MKTVYNPTYRFVFKQENGENHAMETSDLAIANWVESLCQKAADLDAAYAELAKLWAGHNVLFDREVYDKVQAWYKINVGS
jgi:hypothetical protein